VVVHFNDYYTANTTQDRITACHELGHALGLAHNTSLNSCLYGVQNIHASTTPSTDDFNTLRYVIYP
jgi:predicted Zn-dependent protease